MEQERRKPINYKFIGEAVEYYKSLGYTYVEVPWVVEAKYVLETLPDHVEKDHKFILKNGNHLVGSAEQSFMAMDLPDGEYVAASPCFRDEPKYDENHFDSFFKIELYESPPRHPIHMLCWAKELFKEFGADPKTVETKEGYDLFVGDLEVGSYGIREAFGKKWTYGTGLAEPRFSMALNKSL